MHEDDALRYRARRERAFSRLGSAALVLPAAPLIRAGRDLELRYRPDPDLFYLTGYTEPEAVAVLTGDGEARFTLFVRPRDAEAELWSGARGGVDAAREHFGADAAYPLQELERRLPELLSAVDALYLRFDSARSDVLDQVRRALPVALRARQRHGSGATAWHDAGRVLDELRLLKDAHEIELMRQAARLTGEAFIDAVHAIRPGAGEWELEAAVELGFRSRGADGIAFATIAASGANATVLHYTANTSRMAAGELVLLDAGATRGGYAADVSRTFPVSGRFTQAQRDVYEVVLAARAAAIAAAVPGAPVDAVHTAAARTIQDALVQLGLVAGDVEAEEGEAAARTFLPHRAFHWLGLDVHDVGDYVIDGEPRLLRPNMVLTVEPGIYVPSNASVPVLAGIGIRVEDDILITAQGADVLTDALPFDADAIEAMLSS